MQDRVLLLVREVERIVTTPYAVSLHDLESLIDGVSSSIIRQWADSKPCQVPLLAAVILEQLPHSCVLLGRFADIQEFRDNLLKHKPALLDQLLQRATDDGDSESFAACASMLSCPLPQSIAAPARVDSFLAKLLQNMMRGPCARTIRPLHQVMAGLLANPNIVKSIPESLMVQFQFECTKMLRNLNDHIGNLLALATFARIQSLWVVTIEAETEEYTYPTWLASINQFFGPKRSQKTLDLVVCSAIMACSTSCDTISAEDTVNAVQLAIEICQAIEEEQKKIWLGNNASRMAKLCEKLTRNGMNVDLQITGLTLLITFSPSLLLPREVQNLARQRLLSEDSWNALRQVPNRVVTSLVERLTASSDEGEMVDVVTYALSALQSNEFSDSTGLIKSKIAIIFLAAMRKRDLSASFSVRFRCLSDLEETIIQSCIKNFPSQPNQTDCGGSPICRVECCTTRDSLLIEFLMLYYKATHGQSRDSIQIQVEAICVSFLDKVKFNLSSRIICGFSKTETPERSRTLFIHRVSEQRVSEPTTTMITNGSSKEWRARMGALLLENSRFSHEFIVQQMEEICRDLEFRCHNIEAPLRAVTDERDSVESQLAEVKNLNSEMEHQSQESLALISDLRAEIARLEQQVASSSTRADSLESQVTAIRVEIEKSRQESQDSAEIERTRARTRELDLMATVTERDDQVDDLQAETVGLKRENLILEEARDNVIKENKIVSQERDSLRMEITSLQGSLKAQTTLKLQQDNELQSLVDQNKHLTAEVQSLRDNYEHEKTNGDSLRLALDTEIERKQSVVTELNAKLDSQIFKSHADIQEQADRHRKEVYALQVALNEVKSKSETELQSKAKRIQHLERKVESMRHARAVKTREFSEAQEHISRLMSVMGFAKGRKDGNQSLARTGQNSEYPSAGQSPDRREAFLPSQEDVTSFRTQLSIQTSPISRNRRPCRGHSLKPGQDLLMNKATDVDLCKVSRQETLRQPLSDIDRNSPTKSPQICSKVSDHEEYPDRQLNVSMERATLEDIDLDFDDGDLFTGTASS